MGNVSTLDPPAGKTDEGEENDGLGPGSPPADPDPQGAGGEPPAGPPPTPPAALPDDGPEAQKELPGLEILGDRELGLKVGGRKPDSAVLKVKGCKVDLTGPKGSQFDRGDRVVSVTVLQVTGDNDQDTIDTRTGDVKSTSKTQNATLCGFTRIEEYLDSKLAAAGFDREEIDRVLLAVDADTVQSEAE